MLASCGGSEDETTDPTPTPKPNEPAAFITMNTNIPSGGLTFDVNGGEKSVSFTTNKDWTVTVAATTGGATWCTASPASGSQGDATVKFSVKENTDYDDRSVSVTIKAGTATKTFTINQKGADALLVTTKKYEVAQVGEEIEVEVQANIDYEMEISETAKSWITESATRALTTHKHAFTIAANEEAEKREGEIVFKSGDKVETVTVYQAGGPVLVFSKNEFNVSDAGETITIEVKSNIDFGVQLPDVDWIVDEASTRGMSSHTLKYDILPNETYDAREAEIIFYDKNSDLKETVKVVQAQKDAIIISQKNYEVKVEGETIEVKLSANVDFDVTIPDVDWITQVTTRGLTEHTLYYSVAENTSEDSRSAVIVFTDKDSQISETVLIVQEGVFEGSYTDGVAILGKPGTLKELLGDDCLKITSLKIIGRINGDDIRCLRQMLGGYEFSRNERGKLVTLDLSEATIVAGGSWYYEVSESEQCYTKDNVIGSYMFRYANPEILILPDNATIIEDDAFHNSGLLKSITFGEGLTSIGEKAFYGCDGLTSIVIPDNVTLIGKEAFWSCEGLTSITLGKGLVSIEDNTFYACTSLTSIVIPDNVTSIGESAFSGCTSLNLVVFGKGLSVVGASAFSICNALTSVIIPDNITSLGNGSFYGCDALASVTIGKGLTSIGEGAFGRCATLASIVIPDNVTTIGESAFSNCSSLASATIGNGVITIGDDAFKNCSLTSVTIGSSVQEIGGGAFQGCAALPSITIPNSVTTLGGYAFAYCSSLKSVTIGDGVVTIDYSAFSDCILLEEVTLGNSVATIGNSAFQGCTSLTAIVIPGSVEKVSNYAFKRCTSLAEVTCKATMPPSLGSQAFQEIASPSALYVPNDCSTVYSESDWAQYFDTIEEK